MASLIQKKFICPICGKEMKVKNGSDGVKFLKCTECDSEIHFGSWGVQKAVVEDDYDKETLYETIEK